MSLLLKFAFGIVILFSFIFASWYVIHADIVFSSDIGRDFQLLREVDQKKIVLIGPRTSSNLYHGSLWLYVNYPAYLIGKGNPVVVGWNWVLLWALFTSICFFVGKKLFDTNTSLFFTMWSSLYFAFHVRGMDNPHGALLVMPLFIYFLVKYQHTLRLRFLLLYLLTLGVITQFEIAIGIAFILLSIPFLVYNALKQHTLKHLLSLALIPLLFTNFILFDLRHQFLLLHKALEFASPRVNHQVFNYSKFLLERVTLLFSNIEFLRVNISIANIVLFIFLIIGVYRERNNTKIASVAFPVLYFYIGFFVLSFIDKGPILYWYLYPMYPMFFLVASSFVTSRYRIAFVGIFAGVILLNITTAIHDMNDADAYFGHNVTSWKFLDSVAKKTFAGKETAFGYFVYAPDAFAYAEKYAMYYESTRSPKHTGYFTKLPITYVVAEPPPPNNPYMKSDFWIQHQINITATPSTIVSFPNGYQILKYHLTPAQIQVSFDPSIDPGINFR